MLDSEEEEELAEAFHIEQRESPLMSVIRELHYDGFVSLIGDQEIISFKNKFSLSRKTL